METDKFETWFLEHRKSLLEGFADQKDQEFVEYLADRYEEHRHRTEQEIRKVVTKND